MHPDNNPLDLAAGQLYLKDPETGATVPCEINLGSGDTLAEITVQDIDDVEELRANAVQYLRELNQQELLLELDAEGNAWAVFTERYIQPMVAAYTEWLRQIVDEAQADCIKWAKENRKKWLHIGRTTKKARTRKKYAALIWREYTAANPGALARLKWED